MENHEIEIHLHHVTNDFIYNSLLNTEEKYGIKYKIEVKL